MSWSRRSPRCSMASKTPPRNAATTKSPAKAAAAKKEVTSAKAAAAKKEVKSAKAAAPKQEVTPAKAEATRKAAKEQRAAATATSRAGADPRGSGDELQQQADGTHPRLTTAQGIPVADNQNSLRPTPRGPTLLEDFVLREKITHFDHERIPERIVHARGHAAHGYFELTDSLR